MFYFERQEDFANLSIIGALIGQKEVTRHLHRDGTAAGPFATGFYQIKRCTHQSLPGNPWMRIESLVFSGDDGVLEAIRHLGNQHGFTPLFTVLGNQIAFGRIDA